MWGPSIHRSTARGRELAQDAVAVRLRTLLGDVVHQQGAHGSAVVGAGDGSVALLARCVPDLCFDGLAVHLPHRAQTQPVRGALAMGTAALAAAGCALQSPLASGVSLLILAPSCPPNSMLRETGASTGEHRFPADRAHGACGFILLSEPVTSPCLVCTFR